MSAVVGDAVVVVWVVTKSWPAGVISGTASAAETVQRLHAVCHLGQHGSTGYRQERIGQLHTDIGNMPSDETVQKLRLE